MLRLFWVIAMGVPARKHLYKISMGKCLEKIKKDSYLKSARQKMLHGKCLNGLLARRGGILGVSLNINGRKYSSCLAVDIWVISFGDTLGNFKKASYFSIWLNHFLITGLLMVIFCW